MTAAEAAPVHTPDNPAARIPRATYRLQLHGTITLPGGEQARFDFRDAARVVPYLARLGISTLYLSPIWQATPGSSHGYDATDHSRVSDDLGGEKGLRKLWKVAQAHGLTMIADFVPNHMGIAGGHNPYWEDVLRHGQASRYAHFFDISWQPLKRALSGKVLLPVLGDQYGRVLERGELQVERRGGELTLRYFERAFPLSPRLNAPLLERAWEHCGLPENDETRLDLASLALQAANLPRSSDNLTDQDRESRARETAVIERRLAALTEVPAVAKALDEAIAELNADKMRLDAVIQEQNYRLSYWKVASEQINYRRFFDINDLAALRIEDQRVFDWAHSKLFELIKEGVLAGVRLDHTDGLYDPAGYFQMLQQRAAEVLGVAYQPGDRPLYVLAEKILEPGERLPDWPIYGTTGYDFLAQIGGVFVEGANEDEISGIYRRFTGDRQTYGQTLHDTKEIIQRVSLASEVNVLAEQLERLAEADLRWRDFTLSSLREVLTEVIAAFPVYRTYVRPGGERETGDNLKIAHAIGDARKLNRELDRTLFDFVQAVLTLDAPDPETRERYADFALKFQQLTGPVTAKGAEDTAFYRYGRLLSLNEVGGDPAIFGTTPRSFHAQARERGEQWPHAMLAGSTHDTKRGEDTRARIAVLSEMPQTWAAYLSTWSRLSRPLEQELPELGGGRAPSSRDQLMLFQNLLGIWPLDGDKTDLTERLNAAMLKSVREAKLMTSWAAPDEAYEGALEQLIGGLLDTPEFTSSIEELHRRISPYGVQNSLSAALVRFTAPGVPDTYQGSEVWNQSLVDPDNRRPVEYARLSTLLRRIEERFGRDPLALAEELLPRYQNGGVKLLTSWAALKARQAQPELFAHGNYQALSGGKHVLAFARQLGQERAVTVAPRLTYTLTRENVPWALGEVWGTRTLSLPSGPYRNALTGERFQVRGEKIPLAKVLEFFPVALLIGE
ncbi:malto-oligosyltrehalose synthase [Deinococcus irradiatisoli]|uniref:Malto-oligosyltrehalose synthase n=1 Tax=Deinococcus irradiatisoli TaxID=2202254 RepID=A0A2Z3JF12_9DEIO|nr:malto-oligosyltrehalose synthase [Deinococcus irradiatisoli]AWN22576.1 malto-oligosyltrehalose synthase [Deinococcus irradiatisoli]